MELYLRAAADWLKPFGLPVYAAGQVPGGAEYPYITLQAAYAPFTHIAALTVIAYFRGSGGHEACVKLVDRMWQSIPPQGLLLRYKGGMTLLTRPGGAAASLVTDENDRAVVGGCLRLTARFYDV